MDRCQNYVQAYAAGLQLSHFWLKYEREIARQARRPPTTDLRVPSTKTEPKRAVELINFHVDISLGCIFNERSSAATAVLVYLSES